MDVLVLDLEEFIEECKKRVFWINRYEEEFKANEINDDYLKHILYFVAEGGGWDYFLTKEKVNNIYQEAYNRNLLNPTIILTLHSWALYNRGYETEKPKYKVDWNGNYRKA